LARGNGSKGMSEFTNDDARHFSDRFAENHAWTSRKHKKKKDIVHVRMFKRRINVI
jgi:hypothetical protein